MSNVSFSITRTNAYRPLPTADNARLLRVLGDRVAALWNVTQYDCRHGYGADPTPFVRPIRSRVRCPHGHQLHADVAGARNRLQRTTPDPEVRGRAGGRPRWITCRWNGVGRCRIHPAAGATR